MRFCMYDDVLESEKHILHILRKLLGLRFQISCVNAIQVAHEQHRVYQF